MISRTIFKDFKLHSSFVLVHVFPKLHSKPYYYTYTYNHRYLIQLFQLRLSTEQSGKVEYERERLLGIAIMHFQSGSQQPFALVFDFSAICSWTTLIHN